MAESLSKPTFPRLNEKNYSTWTGSQRAELQKLGVWLIVKERIVAPTDTNADEVRKWLVDSDKAAGSIYASIEPSQRVHVKGLEENPIAMWKALEAVHRQKKPGARFAAYNALFSIYKDTEETLPQLVSRIDNAVTLIQELRPPAHTMAELDGELASMAMIRALPEDFQAFRSSLFLLPQLDKATVTEAFILEQADRDAQVKKNADMALALRVAALATTAGMSTEEFCEWCRRNGHLTKDCRTMSRARDQTTAKRSGSGGKFQAKTAQADEEAAGTVTEFAGNIQGPLLI